MKRPRSYGEDLEDDTGENKGVVFKDWARRDSVHDRLASSSSQRRFYYKGGDPGRKGSGSSSSSAHEHRLLEDDRELKSRSRKRFDYDLDAFDRRKGGFDRYWDGVPDRSVKLSSSPRVNYGGDRMRRSENFSVSRREFPKGFRSDKERSRREGSSGYSWRRSGGVRDTAEEEMKSGAAELMSRGSRVMSEDRSRSRSKDSSSGEPTRSVDLKKPVEARKESDGGGASGGRREMEEGELEPESETVPEDKPNTTSAKVVEQSQEPQQKIGFGEVSDDGGKFSGAERLDAEKEEACKSNDNDLALETNEKSDEEPQNLPRHSEDGLNKVDEEETVVIEKDAELAASVEQQVEKVGESKPCSSSSGYEPESLDNEKLAEEVCEHPQAGAISPPSKEDADLQRTEEVTIQNELDTDQCEEIEQRGKTNTNLDSKQDKEENIDLQAELANVIDNIDSRNEDPPENKENNVTLELLSGKGTENNKDKGKSLATSLSNDACSIDDDGMEGPSTRGFELVFSSEAARTNEVSAGAIVIGKNRDEKLELESLDLSLGLPGTSSYHPDPKPRSLERAWSIQSLPSFRSNSDGFTASLSISGSHTFIHNPSCSLTQNSMENYEHSVGSRPVFQSIDQVSDSTVWRGQSLSDLKQKTEVIPFHQRMLVNNALVHQSSLDGQLYKKSSVMPHQSSLYKSSSYAQHPHEQKHDFTKEKEVLTREKSSNSLIANEQQVQPTIPNGAGSIENVLTSVVLEPLQVIGRMIKCMTEQSITHLKDAIFEICTSKNKCEELCRLQEALLRKSDLKLETLSSCPRPLLEILVTIKTGLTDFLKSASSSSDLVEIFLNLKCRNLACRNALPVDECECKVCSQKSGFCSMCMCLVCSKFDLASNTCSWVGCDFCLHWCHTDCALRESLIRNDTSITGAQGTEMQFLCTACNHPSEMFGFVKDVFKNCAKGWNAETLAKELEYVRRIFSASNDLKGRKLFEVANHALMKLENKANLSEVHNCIMGALAENDSNLSNNPTILPPKETIQKNKEESNGLVNDTISCRSNQVVGSSSASLWLPSVSTEKSPLPGITGAVVSSLDFGQLGTQAGTVNSQKSLEKKPVEHELESIIKFKEAESKMYQAHADDARREAEGLKRIAIAKNEKIDAEYAGQIAKLCLLEAEERRRQKLEEFQALERAQRDYFNMKIRMEAEIKELILKMEATRRNLST